MIPHKTDLILASKSQSRQAMLRAVGLEFRAIPADIDERTIEDQFTGPPHALALELARQKALHVSRQYPESSVIGSDQILEFDGSILHKAQNSDEALTKLEKLNGQTHHLISAVALARDGEILWDHFESAHLTMHQHSAGDLQDYIDRAGDALTRSVGAYELESTGAWLFQKIEGDYFTILGLPLLSFLGYLRSSSYSS